MSVSFRSVGRNFGAFAFVAGLVACSESDAPVEAAHEAAVVCAGPKTLKGLDVAHYDGDVDWASVVADGNAFAFAKATEGTTFTDPKFAQNWANMKASGITRGAYHFFHANDDPIVEADFFLSVVGDMDPGDMPPTLDLEVDDGETAATITANAILWLDHVAAVTGKKPILYTSKRVVTEYLGNAMGLDQHAVLWDAQWDVTCPDIPDTYSTWAFWQSTDVGTVPGVPTPNSVDIDTFNGDLAALLALGVPPSTSSSSSGGGSVSSSTIGSSSSQGAFGASVSTSSGGPSSGEGGTGDTSDSKGCTCAFDASNSGSNADAIALGLIAIAAIRRRARST
jgi:lysozyme